MEVLAEYAALRDEIVKRIEIRCQLLVLTLAAFGVLLSVGVEKDVPEALLVYPLLALCMAIEWMHVDVRIGEMGDYIREHIEKEPASAHDFPWWETHIEALRSKEYRAARIGKRGSAFSTTLRALRPIEGGWKWTLHGFIPRATEASAAGVLCLTGLIAVFIAAPRIAPSTESVPATTPQISTPGSPPATTPTRERESVARLQVIFRGAAVLVERILLVVLDLGAIGLTIWMVRRRRRKYARKRRRCRPATDVCGSHP